MICVKHVKGLLIIAQNANSMRSIWIMGSVNAQSNIIALILILMGNFVNVWWAMWIMIRIAQNALICVKYVNQGCQSNIA